MAVLPAPGAEGEERPALARVYGGQRPVNGYLLVVAERLLPPHLIGRRRVNGTRTI